MNEFLGWIGPRVIVILTLLVVWWGVKYAFKTSTAGWKIFELHGATILTIAIIGVFGVSILDWMYTSTKTNVEKSKIGADMVGLFNQSPATFGFTGQGTLLTGGASQSAGTVPLAPAAQSVPIVINQPAVAAPQAIVAPTSWSFPPAVVILAGSTLTLYHEDGRIESVAAADVGTPTACGIGLTDYDARSGKPATLYVCDGGTMGSTWFSGSEVTLPEGFPQPSVEMLNAALSQQPSQEAYGGGAGIDFYSQQFGNCIASWLTGKGFENVTSGGAGWLPQGSSWTLRYASWSWGWATNAAFEDWRLTSLDWPGIEFRIKAELAQSFNPKGDQTTVFGTASIPNECAAP